MSKQQVKRVPSLDEIVLRLVLYERKTLYPMWDLGIRPHHLGQEVRKAIEWVESYRASNQGSVPGDGVLAEEMGWTVIPGAVEFREEGSFIYFANKLREHLVYRMLKSRVDQVSQMLNGGPGKVDEALKSWFDLPEDIVNLRGGVGSLVSPVNTFYPELLSSYERYKAGEVGLDLLWPTLTREALLQPGQNAWIVARPGTGKTWFMLMLAQHLDLQGYKTLFVSPEVRGVSFAERHASHELKISYYDLIRGQLGAMEEERLRERVLKATANPEGGVRVASSDFRPSREAIEAMVERDDPDVLFLDSVYLYGKGKSRSEVLASVVPWVVELCSMGRPRNVFATAQLNREGDDGDSVTGSNIYGTDAIQQDADLVLAMIQSAQMRKDKQMKLKFLKRRRATYAVEGIDIEWDMDAMSFNELSIPSSSAARIPSWPTGAGFDPNVPF